MDRPQHVPGIIVRSRRAGQGGGRRKCYGSKIRNDAIEANRGGRGCSRRASRDVRLLGPRARQSPRGGRQELRESADRGLFSGDEPAVPPLPHDREHLLRRRLGRRLVPDSHARGAHPHQQRVRGDGPPDPRRRPEARLPVRGDQGPAQQPRPHRSRRRACLAEEADRRPDRDEPGGRRIALEWRQGRFPPGRRGGGRLRARDGGPDHRRRGPGHARRRDAHCPPDARSHQGLHHLDDGRRRGGETLQRGHLWEHDDPPRSADGR